MKMQSHGLTVGETVKRKEDQQRGIKAKIKCNVDPSFEIDAQEKHLIHVQLHKKNGFDAQGKDHNPKFVQMFYVDEFERMSKTEGEEGKPVAENAFSAFNVKIIHDPRLKDKEVKAEERVKITYDLVSKLPLPKLFSLYEKAFGEIASDDSTAPQLIALISEKLELEKPVAEEVKPEKPVAKK